MPKKVKKYIDGQSLAKVVDNAIMMRRNKLLTFDNKRKQQDST